MMALVVAVFAQSCTALLPAQQDEIEWFRDGRPFARDVLIAVAPAARTYQRRYEDGRRAERSLSCTTTRGASWLVDRTGSTTVRIPVGIDVGDTRTSNGATTRRIRAPADAGDARGTSWYSVSSPGLAVYAVARSIGILEVRTPAPAGGFTVLRAVVRERRSGSEQEEPATPPSDEVEQRARLLERIVRLEQNELMLRDSIAALLRTLRQERRVPASSPDVVEFVAVDVYVERGEFTSAIELLESVRRRLRAWSDSTGARHAALDVVDERLHEVLRQCAEAAATPARSRPVQCRTAW